MRPSDEPNAAKIDFDWCQTVAEASTRRAELRRQKWLVRRRELELIASKNFLLPRLDGVARYRWRGFGDTLFPDKEPPLPRFDNAYSDLLSGDFQEWQLGFELNVPIGGREGHVAERNAELLLARERAILRDQQREIVHEAADAVAEVDRSYTVLQTSYNRLAANRDQLGAVQAAYEADKAPLDLFLDAQRRVADAETDYFLNRTRYTLSTKNMHFVKGTLLDYDGVHLAEGPWPEEAYVDAARREASRGAPKPLNYASSLAPVVSKGPFPQNIDDPNVAEAKAPPQAPLGELPAPATGTLPSEEVIPLPPQNKSPSNSAPPQDGTKLMQPEVIQAVAKVKDGEKGGSIIGAGHGEALVTPTASIAFRPESVPMAATDSKAEPAAPTRLPATATP
jgi:hypothetical protein